MESASLEIPDPPKKEKKPEKPILLVPNMKEYLSDPRGFVIRADLRGMTRKEHRAEKKLARKARIKELKARSK